MLAVNILGLIAGIVLMIVGVLLVGGEDAPQNPQYFAFNAPDYNNAYFDGVAFFVVYLLLVVV